MSRHYLVAAGILIAGVIAAIFIYAHATVAPEGLLELSPDTSKAFARDLQRYGGNANVLALQLRTWFAGLWHGKNLAFTVVVLAALLSAGYLFFTVVFAPHWRAAAFEQRRRTRGDAAGGRPE